MSPSLVEGDIVAWAPTNIEDVKVGDVVVYKSYIHWPDEKIVAHRVSKIETDSKGTLTLESKGDNNKWTDQAGPHIPEPYIREDHLMGKVLSIGGQPLKIPFIGNIGVWINQGLESLSKPTASKESINFIGIFGPLTISIVFLVVFIFLYPDRASTLKEKIRLFIFGKNVSWILKINLSEIKQKETKFSSIVKPILAALIILPLLFFMQDELLAIFIAVIIAGVMAYIISCKKRSKIVLAVLTTIVIGITHMLIQSNLVIISNEQTMMELMALTFGAIGLYLLLLSLLLIPLALISWFIVHLIRNLKERKDPLLALEGSCNLETWRD
jgi:signal peptidase